MQKQFSKIKLSGFLLLNKIRLHIERDEKPSFMPFPRSNDTDIYFNIVLLILTSKGHIVYFSRSN